MTLGERLLKARKHAGLTQKQLEEKSGVSQQTISNIERGIQEESTNIVELAMACNVRSEWLAIENGDMLASTSFAYTANSPEAKVICAMQHMDEATKYQLVKIGDSLAEPTDQGGKNHPDHPNAQ